VAAHRLRQLQLDFARPVFVRSQAPSEPQLLMDSMSSPRKTLLSPLNALGSTPAVTRAEWAEVRDACKLADAAKLQQLVSQGVLLMRKPLSPGPPSKPPPVAVTSALTNLADAAVATPVASRAWAGGPGALGLLPESLHSIGPMGAVMPVPVHMTSAADEARRAAQMCRRTLESMQGLDLARDALAAATAQLEQSLVQVRPAPGLPTPPAVCLTRSAQGIGGAESLRRVVDRVVELDRQLRTQQMQAQVAAAAASAALMSAAAPHPTTPVMEMTAPSPQKL
jgi:hypothetical protein